jgi:hypothetical protein
MHAGQAVVQFAYGRLDKQDYAIKFFLSKKALDAEEALYGHTTLGQFLPQVVASCVEAHRIRDPWGGSLPACMVMERGEALDLWMDRAQPDKYMAFSVRSRPLSAVALFASSGKNSFWSNLALCAPTHIFHLPPPVSGMPMWPLCVCMHEVEGPCHGPYMGATGCPADVAMLSL